MERFTVRFEFKGGETISVVSERVNQFTRAFVEDTSAGRLYGAMRGDNVKAGGRKPTCHFGRGRGMSLLKANNVCLKKKKPAKESCPLDWVSQAVDVK